MSIPFTLVSIPIAPWVEGKVATPSCAARLHDLSKGVPTPCSFFLRRRCTRAFYIPCTSTAIGGFNIFSVVEWFGNPSKGFASHGSLVGFRKWVASVVKGSRSSAKWVLNCEALPGSSSKPWNVAEKQPAPSRPWSSLVPCPRVDHGARVTSQDLCRGVGFWWQGLPESLE